MVIPNALAQNRAISYTAKGLFIDLISRPEGWRETCRQMADSSPQGRRAVEGALDELRAWGYYRVDVVRLPNGRLRSEAHLFDVPQRPVLPGADMPASGEPERGDADALLGKYLVKEPSLPVVEEPQAEEPRGPLPEAEKGGEEDEPDSPTTVNGGPEAGEDTRAAAAVLLRAVRPERRLPLGQAEAAALAPLVRAWLDRGGSEEGLREALLAGLPGVIYSPAKVVQSRLERKMPPQRPDVPRLQRRRLPECRECRDPLPKPGLCSACSGSSRQSGPNEARARTTARGLAKVRAAMATRPFLSDHRIVGLVCR